MKVESMKLAWTPLAEMHLLLREHGWEPEQPEPWLAGADKYGWRHTDYKGDVEFLTSREGWYEVEVCAAGTEDESRAHNGRPETSVASLRRRLKQLVKK